MDTQKDTEMFRKMTDDQLYNVVYFPNDKYSEEQIKLAKQIMADKNKKKENIPTNIPVIPDYNPQIIISYANQLTSLADGMMAITALVGAALLGFLGYSFKEIIGAATGAIIGAVLGLFIIRPLAFALKLLAQQALCNVCIELNTRK